MSDVSNKNYIEMVIAELAIIALTYLLMISNFSLGFGNINIGQNINPYTILTLLGAVTVYSLIMPHSAIIFIAFLIGTTLIFQNFIIGLAISFLGVIISILINKVLKVH